MTDHRYPSTSSMETFAESQIAFEISRPSGKSVDEVLDAAADLIESDGHSKGQFRSAEGYCALGALRQVEFGCTDLYRNYDEDPGYFAPLSLSEEVTNTPTGWLWSHLGQKPISYWNDATATTKGEVVQTLRDAATKYRNR